MLGDGVGGGHDGELVCRAAAGGLEAEHGAQLLVAVCGGAAQEARGVEAAVEEVLAQRGLEGLVVLGQRAVDHAVGLEAAVLLPEHEEGLVVGLDGLDGAVCEGLAGGEVGDVEAVVVAGQPLLGLLVPLDQRLVWRPGLALHVCRGAVVDDAPVVGPCEGPVGVQTQTGGVLVVAAADGLLGGIERRCAVGVEAGVDPHAAGGGAVCAQLGVASQKVDVAGSQGTVCAALKAGLPVGALDAVAVESPGDGTRVDLAVDVVVPLHLQDGIGVGATLLCVEAADLAPQQVADLVVRLGLVPGLDGLVAPLHPAAGVEDGAGLLVDERAGQEVAGGADLGCVHIRGVPERCGFGDDLVDHDVPVQVCHGAAHVGAVGSGVAGVHAPCEVALDGAVLHLLEGRHLGPVAAVVAGDLGPPVVAIVVFDRGVVAVPLLEGGHHELGLVGVVAVGVGLALEPVREGVAVGGVGPLEVGGLLVDQHAHVGCALDVGLAAQRAHAAAGDAHVAAQQLQDGHGAGVLGAVGVLGLAQSVEDGACLAGGAAGAPCGVDGAQVLDVHAADLADLLHGVAGVVLLEDLVHATGVGEGLVHLGDGEHGLFELRDAVLDSPCVGAACGGVPGLLVVCLIVPGVGVVGLGFGVPAREQAGFRIELVVLLQDVGGVGVVDEVLEVVLVHLAGGHVLVQTGLDEVLDHVVVQAAVEGDVRTGADGAVDVCHLCGAGVAGIHHDPDGALLVRLVEPLGAHGVVLSGVGADVQDDVGVLHVGPMGCHRASTE